MIFSNKDKVLLWLQEQLKQRPEREPRDSYKLLYQGILGPEHWITSFESFAQWLVEELDAMEGEGNDPLWEAIRPDGALGRLNLRPFKAQACDLTLLVEACLETAGRKWGQVEELTAVWEQVVAANNRALWAGWNLEELMEITQLVQTKGYPPLGHSQAYRQAYRPAYRLVAADLLLGLRLNPW